MNTNGPLGDDWRFNIGGFYRYDHGVRDPGFPGISGGQIKANITRLLPNGYFRVSAKYIDDRNQFILDLPFQNPGDPKYVPGFGDYGSMNTLEGNDIRVPTPNGQLELPLDNGLRTVAGWLTADVAFDLSNGWRLQNAAQAMQNAQQWNAIVPSDVMSAADFVTRPVNQGGLGFPAGTQFTYTYTNRLDETGKPMPFSTSNGLVAPGGEWHVEKPLSAFQDQFQLKKSLGQNNLALGLYFANYSQTNRWYFTDILTNVANNPSFLDLVVNSGGKQIDVTKNGFRHFVSNYVNGSGQATILSGSLGGEFKLTDRLRADVGGRWESNNFVQSSENTSLVDLDGNPATTYDNESWGNNTFRHFDKTMNDWAGSLGLNFRLTNQVALYALGSRSYKMPALDEFLNAQSPAQVDLFGSRQVQDYEGGVKYGLRAVRRHAERLLDAAQEHRWTGSRDGHTNRPHDVDRRHESREQVVWCRVGAVGPSLYTAATGSECDVAQGRTRCRSGSGHRQLDQRRPADHREHRCDLLHLQLPADGRLAFRRTTILGREGRERPSAVQLLQLRSGLYVAAESPRNHGGPAQRLPVDGARGGEPAAGAVRWWPDERPVPRSPLASTPAHGLAAS
jgi:hypothetical protein